MPVPERAWTGVGAEHTDDELRPSVVRAIDALRWQEPTGEFAMMPALGISACVKELRLPKVSAVAISHDLAPFGLYGIEANYSDGRARIYVLDRGTEYIPLASDFWPKGGEPSVEDDAH